MSGKRKFFSTFSNFYRADSNIRVRATLQSCFRRTCCELSSSERGLAILESALGLVILLPVMIVGVGIAVVLHDQSVLGTLPGDALRSVGDSAISVGGGAQGVSLVFSEERAQSLAALITQRMERSVRGETILIGEPSIKACVWRVRVHPATGQGTAIERTSCSTSGSNVGALNFANELRRAMREKIGIPLLDGSGRFADAMLLIGAKVSGKVTNRVAGMMVEDFEFGVVQPPRGELVL